MLIRLNKFRGQSTTEYIFFLVVLFGIFIYFQKYLVRGISGRLRTVGDSFADGRLYDPDKSKTVYECAFDFQYTNKWYDARCYFGEPGSPGCGVRACLATSANAKDCTQCISDCVPPGGQCDVPGTGLSAGDPNPTDGMPGVGTPGGGTPGGTGTITAPPTGATIVLLDGEFSLDTDRTGRADEVIGPGQEVYYQINLTEPTNYIDVQLRSYGADGTLTPCASFTLTSLYLKPGSTEYTEVSGQRNNFLINTGIPNQQLPPDTYYVKVKMLETTCADGMGHYAISWKAAPQSIGL